MRLRDRLLAFFGRGPRAEAGASRRRGPATHVIIIDGTMSSLAEGEESHAGQLYKLILEAGRRTNLTVYYEAGIQWRDWSRTMDVMVGRGINRQIQRAYGVLATRYRPGDRIILAGFSRGAYAVRSLAGIVDLVGLVRADCATERMIRQAYRHYRAGARGPVAEAFCRDYCQQDVQIEAVAVWDTVKALGLRLPLLWQVAEEKHRFHNHELGPCIQHGFHALAHDETREAYAPVLWACPPERTARVEQVWFRGTHGDVGGQLGGFHPARPLANISLVWMLERLASCGLPLPEDWRDRFPCDPDAPSVSTWRGWGKLFVMRKPRVVGRDRSERLHATLAARQSDTVQDMAREG
ncbi:MAG: DUF2235 domain-containing protein [Alphaproteobacteria bacterium]|jgi:uncharacterized protein (DUF2235 family)|nr:DUF2235 domain-containing protein [Alphaproteobacteria bacterium]